MDAVKDFLTYILTPSPAVFIVGLAIVLLVPILLHSILQRSATYTSLPTVLLIGPSGAGKTALISLFERGTSTNQPVPTHTSQTSHAVELAISEDATSSFRDDLDASGSTAKRFLLIDTPGHGKLRAEIFARLGAAAPSANNKKTTSRLTGAKGKLKAIVFLVDAAALGTDTAKDGVAAAAEFLYKVLLALQKNVGAGKSSTVSGAVPVLVAANKLDLFTALPAALVKSNLEAEITRIRASLSKGLLNSGANADDAVTGDESDDWLGAYGSEKFAFSQMREFDIDVDLIGGNIIGDGPGVDKWWKWIAGRI